MDHSNLFVVLMGVGTVFLGLLCIVLLVSLMSWLCRMAEKRTAAVPTPAEAAPPRQSSNGGELLAAISAAIAEDLGTEVSAIAIRSIRRVS